MKQPLTIRCPWCGAPPGTTCRSPSDLPTPPHVRRVARAHGARFYVGAPNRGIYHLDTIADIRSGAPCTHERLMMHDAPRLDAWRVRVVSACLSRVQLTRGAPVAHELLARWDYPIRMALVPAATLDDLVGPLGLPRMRIDQIRAASIEALHATSDHDVGPLTNDYASEAVRLLVLRDFSFQPSDKALVAVAARMRAAQARHAAPVNPPPTS